MKKILALLLLIPSIAIADNVGIVNSSQATYYASQGVGGPLSIDTKSNLILSPLSVISVIPGTPSSLTANAPTAATVGTGSGVALASNTSRKGLVLVNTSVNTISLAWGAAAVLNSGITLLPNSSFTMTPETFNTGELRAIASAGSSNLAIQEYQ